MKRPTPRTTTGADTMPTDRRFAMGALAALALAAAGCPNLQALATSRLVLSTAARQSEPEVLITPTLQAQRGRILYVALQAPDYCVSESVAQTTGQAENRTGDSGNDARVLETFCGVQMGEIERALSQAGYVVANWRALRTYTGGRSNLTPIQYAQQVGAQVLLQVNSLERVAARASRDGRWERAYQELDYEGRATRDLPLRNVDRRALRELLATQEEAALDTTPLGVTLDVNAVFVANGQTVWFYRWTKIAEDQRTRTVRLYAQQIQRGMWMSMAPPGAPDEEDQAVSNEMEALSASQRNSNRDRARLFAQSREVITDFAQRFVQGVGVANGAAGGGLRVPEHAAVAPPSPEPEAASATATAATAPSETTAPAATTPPPPPPPTLNAVPVGEPTAAAPEPRRRRHRRDE